MCTLESVIKSLLCVTLHQVRIKLFANLKHHGTRVALGSSMDILEMSLHQILVCEHRLAHRTRELLPEVSRLVVVVQPLRGHVALATEVTRVGQGLAVGR